MDYQTPLSIGFSRQEYWSGLPFPIPKGLSHLGIEPMSPALAGRFLTTEPPGYPISALDRLEDCRKRGNEKSTGCIRHKCTYGVFSNIDRGKHLASSTKYERGSLDNKGLSLETREVEDGLCRNNWLKRSAI